MNSETPHKRADDHPLGEEEVSAPVGTHVNLWIAAGFGVLAAAVIYTLLRLPLFKGTHLYALFYERGAIQYFPTFFFCFGVVILVLKAVRIREEFAALHVSLLTVAEQQLIRQEEAMQCIRKLKRLPARLRQCLLPNRVWRALVRFKLLGSAEKVDDVLKYQGEIDATAMESSYTILKFIITLLPILGFMGTVMGISEAVSGFSGVVSGAANLDQIKKVLSQVTIGLATAFDTTLLALIMSAILMLAMTFYQKLEEQLLAQIENYCISNLLDRLWVPPLPEQIEAALARSNASIVRQLAEGRLPSAR